METIKETVVILWSAPVYLILILTEIIISNSRQQSSYTLRNTIENVYLSLLNGGLDLFDEGNLVGGIELFL